MIIRFNALSPDEKESLENAENLTKFFTPFSDRIRRDRYKINDCENILKIYLKSNSRDIQLINVFNFDKGEDLETTIIRTLLNCKNCKNSKIFVSLFKISFYNSTKK